MSLEIPAGGGQPVVIGAGIAGLMTALSLAPEPVLVLSKSPLGTQCSSAWAQGGMAASLGADDDPALHLEDTLRAGDGLTLPDVAERIVSAAPTAIDRLARLGVHFDHDESGRIRLGLEAAHSRHRIVHAAGDGTGQEIMRVLVAAVRATPSITVLEGIEARGLIVVDGTVAGVQIADSAAGEQVALATRRAVIATGGIGGLFADSTNPSGSFGHGLALAARAGATLIDLEFVQYHPTALDGRARPMALISEAVRGEGAILIDETGERFLADLPGAELAARDVVARALWRHVRSGHRVLLDARHALGAGFPIRFPAIAAACRAAGIDPAVEAIPVRPAVHYHMGGIAVDGEGRSSVPGLWACGEAAATGLHGANRLASNSLIEGVVAAGWVAESVAAYGNARPGPARAAEPRPAPDARPVRPIVTRGLGILREAESLSQAIAALLPMAENRSAAADTACIGLMMAVAAFERRESRGAHARTDFPERATVPVRRPLRLADALAMARALHPALLHAGV